MHNKFRTFIHSIIYSIVITSSLVHAQEVTFITLDETIQKTLDNNNTIKISNQDYLAAKGDYNQTNSIFLPNISLSHTAISTTNPLMAFGSKLNQEILTQADFNPALLNDPDAIENFATTIEIKQPLINTDGFLMRKAAKAKMSAFELQISRTKDYMVFETKKAYMQLQIAYKAIDVLEKAKEAALANKKLADDNFKQGYLQKADVLSVEVHVTEVENQLQSAKSNAKNASNYLSFLIGENLDVILKPTDELNADLDLGTQNNSLSDSRADFVAMKKSTEAYKNMYKADKMNFLPRLNAFGTYEMYDDKLFGANAKGYTVGAQLSWNILEGTKRFGKAQKSRAEYDKSQLNLIQYKNQSQLEYNKAKRQLKDAENKLQLTKLALEQSNESLRIRTNRFKQGLEKTSDLLIAETQAFKKQLEFYQTVFEYNVSKSYLEFLSK